MIIISYLSILPFKLIKLQNRKVCKIYLKSISLLHPKDIYIEINGIRAAAIKSYKLNISKEIYKINNFSQMSSMKILPCQTLYNIKLIKVCLLDIESVDPIDFFSLCDFNLAIVKPKSYTIFSDCNWTSISEDISIDTPIIQSISLTATKRINY